MEVEKLYAFSAACIERQRLRERGKCVVLTNGCFDLLHPGHMHLLSQAATFGDSLWVALNSDDSVRQLKGPTRPIYGETLRAFTLGSLRVVDGIFLFDGKNVVEEIKKFSPDVYVRAADRTLQDLDSKELQALRNVGARIEFVNFLPNFSTTRIVQHIADVVTKEP